MVVTTSINVKARAGLENERRGTELTVSSGEEVVYQGSWWRLAAKWWRRHTIQSMEDRSFVAKLLPMPFFASFIGRARPGSLRSDDHVERAAAWASWAISALTEMSGLSERQYVALLLDGKFYDPKGTGPKVRPHLEIPARRLAKADAEFPDRLALMGNGLSFPWWLVPEVTAVRRALFNTPDTSIGDLVEVLAASADPLRSALREMSQLAAGQWHVIESLLVAGDDSLAHDAAGDFSPEEVATYFPAGATLNLEVSYDVKLRDRGSARRVGVWQLSGINAAGERFSVGVVTPRLTANSLFRDPLFSIETESAAAALVRGLLLRRLAEHHLSGQMNATVHSPAPVEEAPKAWLRTVVAQPGKKLPEASMAAAVHFLQTYPVAEDAWELLERAAAKSSVLLTITRDGFLAAHKNALRYLRRAEDVERDDVNIILPLGWDDKSRVVRYTFSRPSAEEEAQ